MIYKLEMNEEEVALLIKLLTSRAKEILTWEAATSSTRKRDEYQNVVKLLGKIRKVQGGLIWQKSRTPSQNE